MPLYPPAISFQRAGLYRPAVSLAETIARNGGTFSSLSPLTSGRQSFQRIWLEAGTIVTNITFFSWTQAAVTPTAQWFSLYSAARGKLAVTADDTTTAWGASSAKTLALSSPYTITASDYYYLGIMVAAGTVPSLIGAGNSGVVTGVAPILCGHDGTNTGLTTPSTAPSTAAALTAFSGTLYAYVS